MSGYKTIEGRSSAQIIEKRSRFIATLKHVGTEEEALSFIDEIKSEHSQARHNVYAYILRGGRVRYTDDGEPSQTAGMPTLEALKHAGLEDVACVVTRYFGGTLLGTGGLVRAYSQATTSAIEAADVVSMVSCVDITTVVPYPLYEQAVRLASVSSTHILQTDYADKVTIRFRVLVDEAPAFRVSLIELLRGEDGIILTDPFEAPFQI